MRALDEFKDYYLDIAKELLPDGELKNNESWHLCPFHEDKNPSFSINIETGKYHCFGCGEKGDIINLYARLNNTTDAEAIKELKAKYLGHEFDKKPQQRPSSGKQYKYTPEQIKRFWQNADRKAELVRDYLKGRGITQLPDTLRQKGNVMFALVVDKNGQIKNIHRTILQKEGNTVKRVKKRFMSAPSKGYAVHFGEPDEGVLAVAEGIETALSVKEAISGLHVWATLSADHMKNLELPDNLSKLYIFYDKDKNGVGKKGAIELAKRCKEKNIETYLVEPPMDISPGKKGVDFNDVLLEKGKSYIVEAYRKAKAFGEKDKKEKETAVTKLINLVEENTLNFFKDEQDNLWVIADEGYYPIRSSKFRRLVNKWHWETFKQGLSQDTWYNALPTIEAKAEFGDKSIGIIKLSTRVASKSGKIYYQLGNNKAVEIDENGWQIIKEPVLFRNFAHQKEQIEPIKTDIEDIKRLMRYCNIEKEDDLILILVWLVAGFIPDIPRAMLIVYGSQGSGKSTFFELLKDIIDPSEAGVLSKPKDKTELAQQLHHHYFAVYDNLSILSDWMSDELCRAVTGSGNSKRRLYTDDEDIFYSYKRLIGLNGINVVAVNPDILDRSILIELHRISEEKRMSEETLKAEFKKDKPLILGSIFTILSKTMKIKKELANQNKKLLLPRMADFALWGYCVAEAMDIGGERFLQAYQQNIGKKNYQVIEGNPVAMAVVELANKTGEWQGTASELLEQLSEIAEDLNLNTKTSDWPKTPNVLSRKLNILKVNLQEVGVEYSTSYENRSRIIFLSQRSKENIVATVAEDTDKQKTLSERQSECNDICNDTVAKPLQTVVKPLRACQEGKCCNDTCNDMQRLNKKTVAQKTVLEQQRNDSNDNNDISPISFGKKKSEPKPQTLQDILDSEQEDDPDAVRI